MNPPPGYSTWMHGTALLWILGLPGLLLWTHSGASMTPPPWGPWVTFAAAIAVTHIGLTATLRAGRTVADSVTLGRFALLAVATVLAWRAGEMSWLLWFLIGIALLADLLDGFCARRFGATPGGAILDMETDQAATLCLAWLFVITADAGGWALLLPGYRYAYVLLAKTLGFSAADPKPCDGDNRRARLICAAMMTLLWLGLMPGAAAAFVTICAGLPVGLLAFSYGSDVRFLLRRRRMEPTA